MGSYRTCLANRRILLIKIATLLERKPEKWKTPPGHSISLQPDAVSQIDFRWISAGLRGLTGARGCGSLPRGSPGRCCVGSCSKVAIAAGLT